MILLLKSTSGHLRFRISPFLIPVHTASEVDNVFSERLWRSVKYEEVYIKDYETVCDAKEGIKRYMSFYN